MPNPSPGDVLSRMSDLLVTHYGIAADSDKVLHITLGGAPCIVSLEQFADGKPVSLRRPHLDDLQPVLARMRQVVDGGRLYDLLAFNCEHLKNYVLTGKAYSETVIVLGLFGLVGILLARGRGH